MIQYVIIRRCLRCWVMRTGWSGRGMDGTGVGGGGCLRLLGRVRCSRGKHVVALQKLRRLQLNAPRDELGAHHLANVSELLRCTGSCAAMPGHQGETLLTRTATMLRASNFRLAKYDCSSSAARPLVEAT